MKKIISQLQELINQVENSDKCDKDEFKELSSMISNFACKLTFIMLVNCIDDKDEFKQQIKEYSKLIESILLKNLESYSKDNI